MPALRRELRLLVGAQPRQRLHRAIVGGRGGGGTCCQSCTSFACIACLSSSLARAAEASTSLTRMVELRAVQTSFPFYGALTLEGATYSHDLLRDHGALVRPELLTQLNVRVGDRILIGRATFQIRGVVASEPGRNLGAFSLGPRVFVDFDALDGAPGVISARFGGPSVGSDAERTALLLRRLRLPGGWFAAALFALSLLLGAAEAAAEACGQPNQPGYGGDAV